MHGTSDTSRAAYGRHARYVRYTAVVAAAIAAIETPAGRAGKANPALPHAIAQLQGVRQGHAQHQRQVKRWGHDHRDGLDGRRGSGRSRAAQVVALRWGLVAGVIAFDYFDRLATAC